MSQVQRDPPDAAAEHKKVSQTYLAEIVSRHGGIMLTPPTSFAQHVLARDEQCIQHTSFSASGTSIKYMTAYLNWPSGAHRRLELLRSGVVPNTVTDKARLRGRCVPETFTMPEDACTWNYRDGDEGWIVKPRGSSLGRGVRLVESNEDASQLRSRCVVVQRYVANPRLTPDGRKYDMRVGR